MLKDEYSLAKLKPQNFNRTQRNIINIVFKKRAGRNKVKFKSNFLMGKTCRSLPKIKYNPIKKEENTTTLINYFEKKKHLSFYKGANISVSSIILDTNATTASNYVKNNAISSRQINMKKNKSQNNIYDNYMNMNNNNDDEKKKKKKEEQIKSTINPYLDISKLKYKTDITSIRNKFSLLFTKEFDLFDKFIPSLYTLKFDADKKSILSQLHYNSLSCIQFLSSTFLDQEIEHFKINEKNLTSILTNLLNLFTYNNKITNYLIKHTKKFMVDTHQEKQNNKDLFKVDDNTQINNLKKKIELKDETIKKIKQEKFKEYNDYMVNMYKLRDEKKDLIKLLLLNKEYYNKYKNSQQEIKEKNDIISQKDIDYKSLVKKNFIEKMHLEEELTDLENIMKPIEDENKIMKEKLNNFENQKSMFDEIIKNKNDIINRLKENLMMKEEELYKCLYDLNKLKYQHDKLSYNYIALKNRYKYFNGRESKMVNGDYDNEV